MVNSRTDLYWEQDMRGSKSGKVISWVGGCKDTVVKIAKECLTSARGEVELEVQVQPLGGQCGTLAI